MEKDALKSHVSVARELGFSSRTVKNRLEKLQRERALMISANMNVAAVDGMISAILFYSYTSGDMKNTVDQAILSHFDGNYLWSRLTDPQHGYVVLVAPNVQSVQRFLEWAKHQPGVAIARIEVIVDAIDLWDKASELFRESSQFAVPRIVN